MRKIWNSVLGMVNPPDIQIIKSTKPPSLEMRFQSRSLCWRKESGIISIYMLLKPEEEGNRERETLFI